MDFVVQVFRNINIALWNKQVLWFLRYVYTFKMTRFSQQVKTYRTESAIFEFLEKFPLGTVHKYFGGGWEFFFCRVKLFDPPLCDTKTF